MTGISFIDNGRIANDIHKSSLPVSQKCLSAIRYLSTAVGNRK